MELPRLVRLLIHFTIDHMTSASFPAGEGIQYPGWDGRLAVTHGNAFVPDGVSCWELSTEQDVGAKASREYAKRTANPLGFAPKESTFVFLTPRRWPGKEKWKQERIAEGIWKDVRVIDADDLEQWLEQSPAINLWFSRAIGKHPEGAVDLNSAWLNLAGSTSPELSSEFVLAGRREIQDQIREWLEGDAPLLELRGESTEEGLAAFCAAVIGRPTQEQDADLSRTIVVEDERAWRALSISKLGLVLVGRFGVSPELVAEALRGGHRIVSLMGKSGTGGAGVLELGSIDVSEAEGALLRMGVSDDRAKVIAARAAISFSSAKRGLAISGSRVPAWAAPNTANRFLPVLMLGAWDGSQEGDRQAVERAAGEPLAALEADLVTRANDADPPASRHGETWRIVSLDDAWLLLGQYLTRSHLERISSVAIEVLTEPDPRFELSPEKQWAASMYGRAPRHSSFLREGIASFLAICGSQSGPTFQGGIAAGDICREAVRKILAHAGKDWRVWASLSSILPLLAEAAPDVFLDAVERDLDGDPPILSHLFSVDGGMFDHHHHTGLLFALETLAWSQEHLSRVASLLCGMTEFPLPENLGNKPLRSLRAIFLCWVPQTTATSERRTLILKTLISKHPQVAWKLILELLPEFQASSMHTPLPRFRGWGVPRQKSIVRAEVIACYRSAIALALELATEEPRVWADLLDRLSAFPPDAAEQALMAMEALVPDNLKGDDQQTLWAAIRSTLSRHRGFANAAWALKAGTCNRLQTVYDRLTPADPIARSSWLFDDRPEFPTGEREWQENGLAVSAARKKGVDDLVAAIGLDAVVALAPHVEDPWTLGRFLGAEGHAEGSELRLLSRCLGREVKSEARFGLGLAAGLIERKGREWAEANVESSESPLTLQQRGLVASVMPPDLRTWEHVGRIGGVLETTYWRGTNPIAASDCDDPALPARKLIVADQPFKAAELVWMWSHRRKTRAASELIIEVLEAASASRPEFRRGASTLAHEVGELLDWLGEDPTPIEGDRIARLEWAFLPWLDKQSERSPEHLHAKMLSDPRFFLDVLRLVFRPENEEAAAAITEQDAARARQGFELLISCRGLPQALKSSSNEGYVLEWVRGVRRIAAELGLMKNADQYVGETLSGADPGADGIWPHEFVRRVVEDIPSREIETGIEVGEFNSRGVVSKALGEGGVQENARAESLERDASALADQWPRTAALLRRIAEHYRRLARGEDIRSDLNE